jgi:Glycosyl transferase family 2
MLRCPLCAGLNHTALFGEFLCCKLCSLAFTNNRGEHPLLEMYRVDGARFEFPNWNNWYSRLTGRSPADADSPFYFAPSTVRMFAARQGRRAVRVQTRVPIVSKFATWPYGPTIRATIQTRPAAPAHGPDPRLTLGIIAACAAWPAVQNLCVDLAAYVAEAVIVLDTDDTALAASLERDLRGSLGNGNTLRVRVLAHPLRQDFASQRNRIQHAAQTEWILQLDCDELLSPGAKRDLANIIDDAEREGWDAVALTRRNLVDGAVSALYPDVQYRLLRRSISFTRAVHEYPKLSRGQKSFVYLGAEIIHHLASERLGRREVLYDGIEGGAGRSHDTALLRMPLGPDVMLPA